MSSALARRFKVEVAPFATSAPTTGWVPFMGITDFNPQVSPTMQDVSDYDTDGWARSEKTMQAWSLQLKARRPISSGGTTFDPGQEIVRAAHDQFGDDARVWVRWYDRNGADEAYQGLAVAGWNQSKTGVADVEEITSDLTGDGPRTPIDNPVGA